MYQNPTVQGLINYMSFVLMPLAYIAVVAFAVAGGGLVFTSFGGNGLGVAAVSGIICAVAFVGMLLAARLYRPKPYREAVAEGRVQPVKLF